MVLQHCHEYRPKAALEIGTGCGVVAIALSRGGCPKVVATEVSLPTIAAAARNVRELAPRVHLILCNLFDGVGATFDLVVFNPPYLPVERGDGEELSWAGGIPRGRRLIDRFVAEVPNHLTHDGKALLVQSSLNDLEATEALTTGVGLRTTILEEQSFFFETLYLIELSK